MANLSILANLSKIGKFVNNWQICQHFRNQTQEKEIIQSQIFFV